MSQIFTPSQEKPGSIESNAAPPTRFGQIGFINTLPIVVPMQTGRVSLNAEVVYDTPAGLNEAFARNELHAGAMSAFYFLESGEFELVESVSISATGPVGSVLFYSKVEPSKLSNVPIAVTSTSASSVNLLRILLKEEFGVTPDMVPLANPNMDDYAGMLVIGDEALAHDSQSPDALRFDLGEWWCRLTGKPIVFGVWGTRKSLLPKYAQWHEQTSLALRKACHLGLGDLLPEVLEEAGRRSGHSRERLHQYYTRDLDYQFTAAHAEGLRLYEQFARKHGLLTARPRC